VPAQAEQLRSALSDRYAIERELGRGGMATVYLARDLRHDRPVALKTLHPELAENLGSDRFLREIRLTARLQHPHILTVLDSGDASGLLWFTMPFIDGESLRARLVRERRLDVEPALKIVREVADGLAYAHENGIVHRDIKPENILLSGGHALLADFGIARGFRSDNDTQLTVTGLAVGTPAYMSPEQAVGEAVDPRSDIYSLACVLYEMLAGQAPHTGESSQGVIAARFTTPPKGLRQLRADVPEVVETATLRALSPAPNDRFTTAAEFSAALSAAPKTRAMPTPDKSLAVLPFLNLSPDPENEYFADGMTEELIGALTKVEGLHVVSRTSVFAFKGKQQDIRSIGSQLNVRTVLEGSVRRAGRRLRVAVQLTDVDNGFHLWSDSFNRELEDVFAIQDEISRAIVSALRVKLLGAAPAQGAMPAAAATPVRTLVRRATDDIEAYSAYLKGRHFWNRRHEAELRKGLGFFQEALARDPNYALAHAGIADSYAILGFYCMMPPSEAFPAAKTAALRALEIDPALAEPHPTLAYCAMYHDWDWAEAEREFRTAIELNPGYSTGHQWYGNFMAVMGRREECVAEFEKAVALDPLSGLKIAAVGWGYFFGRQWDESIAQTTRALELDPTIAVAHWWLGLALSQIGQYDKAISEFNEGVQLSNRNSVGLALMGNCLGRAGRKDQARKVLNELYALEKERYVSSYDIAAVLTGLGELEPALDRLEQGYKERTHWMALLKVDPQLDPLREHPRFKRLHESLRFP
jgi:eukaryotic-like serine/threonine-protein kinase